MTTIATRVIMLPFAAAIAAAIEQMIHSLLIVETPRFLGKVGPPRE
jgi:glucose-6-phosphate dehydrogenase assembly protein OpcA